MEVGARFKLILSFERINECKIWMNMHKMRGIAEKKMYKGNKKVNEF